MARQPTPTLPQFARNRSERTMQLAANQNSYRYLTGKDNQLRPICIPGHVPFWKERWRPSWVIPFLPGLLSAYANRIVKFGIFSLQKLTFRFDQMAAYDRLFPGPVPEFAKKWDDDLCFGYRRIAGPNALSIERLDGAQDFADLKRKMPFDTDRIESQLSEQLERPVSLEAELKAGHLFKVDFELLQKALRPRGETRDTRWRRKYMPTPIGLFMEATGSDTKTTFIPLAVQIDQPQFAKPNEHNPVYYPDQAWEWKIAKLYFEVADENFHVGVGHVYRTHMLMDSFAMATPRQLSSEHPIYMLLEPHTRFTLATNKQAYKNYLVRRKVYFKVYACTLEELRQISIEGRLMTDFPGLALDADLAKRRVTQSPADYPYRDDAELWLKPIRNFVKEYVDAFYQDDAIIQEDSELQCWVEELMHPDMGGLTHLIPGGALDTKGKLVDLLAQVIFIAGPGHASQHFSQMYYYRHAPSFAAAAYSPPPWHPERAHRARFLNTLPPIKTASLRFTFSQFGDFQYDDFGDYKRYPLGQIPQAAGPIRKLQTDLKSVEGEIHKREKDRFLPYGFLRPSRVPNSINI